MTTEQVLGEELFNDVTADVAVDEPVDLAESTPTVAEAPPPTEVPSTAEVPIPHPVTAPAPPIQPAPAPDELQALRQYNDALTQQNAKFQQIQVEGLIEQQAQQIHQQYVGQGLPEMGQQAAQQHRQTQRQVLQIQQQAKGQAEHMEGKMNAALHYAELHGVSAKDLMRYETPEAMDAFGRQNKDTRRMQARIAELEKAQGPPPQTFDVGTATPSAGSSLDRLVDSANGKAPSQRTQAERDAMAKMMGY